MNVGPRELLDLTAAWLALGVAFALFFGGPSVALSPAFLPVLAVNLATVGVAFLLHELAHKAVAVRFGQVAAFRADYGMLLLAIAGGLAGFIFAAPGAVRHRGRISERQHGLIALAGPVTNLLLLAAFVPVALLAPELGIRGMRINALLAAFNMLPVGPLDGRTVLGWSKLVYVVVFGPAVALALVVGLGVGL